MEDNVDLATQEGDAGMPQDDAAQDQSPDGQSASVSQLPKEYTPYSKVVPWDQIPDDLRPSVLAGIKKFHGDMSRSSQEAAELKKQLKPLKDRSDFLERLFEYPEIQRAYQELQNPNRGRQQPAQQPEQPRGDLAKLADYGLDKEASGVIQSAIQAAIAEAMAPLADRVRQLNDQVLDREVERQLADLDGEVKSKGLPSPREIIPDIEETISKRRSGIGIKDAYRLATYDKLESVIREKVKRELLEEQKQQQQQQLPPAKDGPYNKPGFLDFGAPLSVEQAIRMARAEMSQRR